MGKKIYITEGQFKGVFGESILDEMAYPSTWNIDTFKGINSFNGRVKYCEQHLKRLSSGSSRIVYQIDDEKVLKLAKNNKGIAQNSNEGDYYLQNNELFAKVFDRDREGLWIEMELANKAKPSDFKRITGYDFTMIKEFITYIGNRFSRYNRSINEKYISFFESEEFIEMCYDGDNIFSNIMSYMEDYALGSFGDLQRISSWGIVKRNGEDALVLIDFGLTNDTYDRYYR